MPIMEEALSDSVKARPPSHMQGVELPSASGFNEDEGDGDAEGSEEEEAAEEEDHQSEEGDAAICGSSSPCSSCPSVSPPDGSVRFPVSSHNTRSCSLHHCHACFFHFSDNASCGYVDGSYGCSFSSHACTCHNQTTASCSHVHERSVHELDEGFFDDGYLCSTSPGASADVKHLCSSCQNIGYASLGCCSILHLSSERQKTMKQPSSCGFNDGNGCDTSSSLSSDESCVVSSCCIAYGNTTYCQCGLCQTFEGNIDVMKPTPLRFCNECNHSALSHACADGSHMALLCHELNCSSTICYNCVYCGSQKGACNTSLSNEAVYGNLGLNHFAPNGLLVISMSDKGITISVCTDSNDMPNGNLSHSSLPHCSMQPDGRNAFEPHVQGTSIRGQHIAQELGGAKCRPTEGLGIPQQHQDRRVRELSRMFQHAVDQLDWQVAEDLIPLANKQRLNDWLCIAVDSFWFLCTHKELFSATQIMEKLVEAGADGFTRAALRTSFLASCVWACQNRTRDLSDTVNVLADRLPERLQECSGYELSSADAVAKVTRMAEWALQRIGLHCQAEMRACDRELYLLTPLGAQLQLRAFKRFLELAGNLLSGEDYTEAFEASCFSLSLFSIVLDSGWASGIAASAMQGLLGMLVEGGADNVNQCCLEAARSGNTELLQMLLQIAQRNGIEVDVDMALGYASHHCKLGTMECLVDVGNATAFLGPLIRAADRGCMPVVKWFVDKGCQDMELCLGLMAAVSSNRVEVIEYLLKCIPLAVLATLSLDIIKAAAERSGGHLEGIVFLLQHDFLGGSDATYEVADRISKLDDDTVSHELKLFCKHEWSNEALIWGRKASEDHFVNVQRVLLHGSSPLQLKELPLQLQVAIAYLPLYMECVASCGPLLSQWLRGQLIEAALRLNEDKCYSAEKLMKLDKCELVALLKARLPAFFVEKD